VSCGRESPERAEGAPPAVRSTGASDQHAAQSRCADPLAHAPLAGRVALVTGGSGGVGRSIVAALATRGADVAIGYVQDRGGAEAAAGAARDLGVRSLAVQANLATEAQVHALVRRARDELGDIDIVVSGAVTGRMGPALRLDTRGFQFALDVNARSLLLLAQLTAPAMRRKRWGRIVALSSIGAARVLPDYTSVGASKAALESLVRHLAIELAPDGITANVVSGSVVDTDALSHFGTRRGLLDAMLARTPAGRCPSPADMAGAVAMLCCDEASMIVGQTIMVDGGYSLVAW